MSHWHSRAPQKAHCTWVVGKDDAGADIACGREFVKMDPRQVVCTYHTEPRRRAVDAAREQRKRRLAVGVESSPPQATM